MTVEHIVLIEPNDGVSEDQTKEVLDGIAGLKNKIPGVVDVKIGKNFTKRAPQISHAVIVTLVDPEALAAYGPHPAHKDVLRILLPFAKNLTIADIEV